jgi:hypothetical protein
VAPAGSLRRAATADGPPTYAVDPTWPRPLPHGWGLGEVAGVAVDARDHVWLVHRPRTLTAGRPAPYHPSWPEAEHGITIDHRDRVWIGGNGPHDHVVLAFTRDGRFALQLGEHRKTGGSHDTRLLGRPADVDVDPATDEVYVADGYKNRRVIVFDGRTGAYRRHWGAYGKPPATDGPLPAYDPHAPPAPTFRNPVHCVRIARDGLVYVCDRTNDRIQVFRKDGSFVREIFVAKDTRGSGSVWDLDLSPDRAQTYLFGADGENSHVFLLGRQGGEAAGRFGQGGRAPGQFHRVHSLAVDSAGNVYTAEVDTGQRAQKFRPASPPPR